MTVLDVILLLFLIPAVIAGMRKGLIKQLVSIAALLVGIWAAVNYSPDLSVYLKDKFPDMTEQVGRVVSFAAILLTTGIVLNLVGTLLTKLVKAATLGWANRLLGVAFAILKTVLILSIAVWAFDSLNQTINITSQESLTGSVIYSFLKEVSDSLFPFLKNLIDSAYA